MRFPIMRTFFLSMLAVLALSVAAAQDTAPKMAEPISAIAVTQCGRAVVIFVTLDSTHMLRFDGKSAAVYTVEPSGKVDIKTSEPVAIEAAMTIAHSARIQTNASLPCDESTT